MTCQYLRHIDLPAVYQELENYSYGLGAPTLANIHPEIAQTLAFHLELRAIAVIEYLYGPRPTWQELRPIDVAAEVSDYIERDIEELADWWGMPPPASEELPDDKWFEQFQVFTVAAVNKAPTNYFELQALLICLLDCVCWLHGRGDIDGLMTVLARVEEAASALAHVGAQGETAKRLAHLGGKKRHEPGNQRKAVVLAEWDATGNEYKGYSDFARIIIRRDNLKETFRTVTGWISDHEKEKRA